jgi:hypothetical protein
LANFKQGLLLPFGRERMIMDMTLTAPGMFCLRELFDLNREMDVCFDAKLVFGPSSDYMWSPLAWPRHILDRHVHDLLAYMEPRSNGRQIRIITLLRSLLTVPTHEERWPEEYREAARKGARWVAKLESIRSNPTTMAAIYAADPELSAWWQNLFAGDAKGE